MPITSPNFVGREKEFVEIHAKLQAGQGVSVCAVEGMGGLGKSELALQYAWRYRGEYAARYWLSLRGVGLAQAVVTLASRTLPLPEVMRSATLEEQAAWYWQNWLPQAGKVLVIFDDVNDLQSIPKQARPLTERFQILVTTRKRKLSSQFADIPLGVISEAEALELLRKLLGKSRVDQELVAATAICEYLGYLPLAVELAGRYLQLDEDLRLSDYRERLTVSDESLALQESEEINATRGVIATFELSWQELSASTGKVAMLLGLFAPADIDWGLVEEIAANLIEVADLQDGRKQLNNLYLIKAIDEERTRFAMHSLTREFLQWKLAQDSDINRLFRETFVMSLLNKAKQISYAPTRDQISEVNPAIPHLDMLSREMLDDVPNPKDDLVWAFVAMAKFYEWRGLYSSAEKIYQDCLSKTKKLLGGNHHYIASTMSSLAELYRVQGQYSEAKELNIKSLKLRKRIRGADHPDTTKDITDLALLYYLQGDYRHAEKYCQDALQILEKHLGLEHPDILGALQVLGAVYLAQDRYKEAESICLRSTKICDQHLEETHPNNLSSLNNLARVYQEQGLYEKAEVLYLKTIRISENIYEDDHINVANYYHNLGVLYTLKRQYKKAKIFLEKSLKIREEKLGADHLETALSLNNLGCVYKSIGHYKKAEILLKRALQIREKNLGLSSLCISDSYHDLGDLYNFKGDFKNSEEFCNKSLQIRERELGLNHQKTAESLTVLANSIYPQGRFIEATNLYERALKIFEKEHQKNYLNISSVLFNIRINKLLEDTEDIGSFQYVCRIYLLIARGMRLFLLI